MAEEVPGLVERVFKHREVCNDLAEKKRLVKLLEADKEALEWEMRDLKNKPPPDVASLEFRIYGYKWITDSVSGNTWVIEGAQLSCGNTPVGIVDRIYLFKPALERVRET